jgi:hypothetical protein
MPAFLHERQSFETHSRALSIQLSTSELVFEQLLILSDIASKENCLLATRTLLAGSN